MKPKEDVLENISLLLSQNDLTPLIFEIEKTLEELLKDSKNNSLELEELNKIRLKAKELRTLIDAFTYRI